MNSAMRILHFSKNFMYMVLFMAQPIEPCGAETIRSSQWDDSPQCTSNGANCPCSRGKSPQSNFLSCFLIFCPSRDTSMFLYFRVPFELKLTVVCQNHPRFLFIFLSIPICVVSFSLFSVYDIVLSMFSVYLCGFASFLSVWFMWLYLLVMHRHLP